MIGRALVALAFCCLAARSADAALALTLRSETRLDGNLSDALDVRWADAENVILAVAKQGVFRRHVASGRTERLIGGSGPGSFFFSSRLGYSSSYIVPGSPFMALAWARNTPGASLSPHFAFDMILDLDVYGDTVAILGARRASDGRWAPEGGIAWVGSLSEGLKDLRPIHYSETGSGAKALDRCHFFNTGAIRFMRDGSIVVVPGVESGMYLYERGGKLLKTWDTQPLGFYDRCELSEQQSHAMALAPTSKWQFLNARTVLDDVIPLPGGGIGVFTRQFADDRMRWTLSVVRDGKVEQRIALPFTGGERSFVRADIRGKQIALLLVEYATSKAPDGARLAMLELP